MHLTMILMIVLPLKPVGYREMIYVMGGSWKTFFHYIDCTMQYEYALYGRIIITRKSYRRT